jgi:hypothetical protein
MPLPIVSLRSSKVKLDGKRVAVFGIARCCQEGKTTMGMSVQLAFRIAIVWAAGFLIAAVVRALLPETAGLTFAGKQTTLMVPFSRIGFWTCLLAALTVTGLVVIRSMLADIGWSGLR